MNTMIRDVDANLILDESHKMKNEGYRLMQICATRSEIPAEPAAEGETATVPAYEIIYTFGMGLLMENLKVTIPQTQSVISITSAYPCAFLYENEMHDLFGITFKHLALDYQGKFFKVATPTPWNPQN